MLSCASGAHLRCIPPLTRPVLSSLDVLKRAERPLGIQARETTRWLERQLVERPTPPSSTHRTRHKPDHSHPTRSSTSSGRRKNRLSLLQDHEKLSWREVLEATPAAADSTRRGESAGRGTADEKDRGSSVTHPPSSTEPAIDSVSLSSRTTLQALLYLAQHPDKAKYDLAVAHCLVPPSVASQIESMTCTPSTRNVELVLSILPSKISFRDAVATFFPKIALDHTLRSIKCRLVTKEEIQLVNLETKYWREQAPRQPGDARDAQSKSKPSGRSPEGNARDARPTQKPRNDRKLPQKLQTGIIISAADASSPSASSVESPPPWSTSFLDPSRHDRVGLSVNPPSRDSSPRRNHHLIDGREGTTSLSSGSFVGKEAAAAQDMWTMPQLYDALPPIPRQTSPGPPHILRRPQGDTTRKATSPSTSQRNDAVWSMNQGRQSKGHLRDGPTTAVNKTPQIQLAKPSVTSRSLSTAQ